MKPFLFKLSLLLFIGTQALAQSRTVTGVVTDKTDGTAIAGANVVAKGTNAGTATDSDGRFSLQVPESATTLVISFLGFSSQEVTIPPSNEVTVILESNASELAEVVVVGSRGSQRTLTDTPLPIDVLST